MKLVTRPNAWVAVEDDPATQLTYAPRVDPAPLTVSVPGRDPTLGSLVIVITNQTATDVQVASIAFTVTVGQPGVAGTPLMPTTAGSHALVSDTTTWSLAWPGPAASPAGTVDCTLTPATGSTATLAAGAAVYVEIYDFQTVQVPSTSTVLVTETIGTGDPAFTNIGVSTFPDGFFFDSLTVNTGAASALVPVAQVDNGTAITLSWNVSIVDPAKQTVYWSSATAGQQHATPAKLGEWSTPPDAPLTSDTVFVVVVKASGDGDEPLTASLATAVSVRNPGLVAKSAEVSGLMHAGTARVDGDVHAATGTFDGLMHAGTARVDGDVHAATGTVAGLLHAGSANVDGLVHAGSGKVDGDLHAATGTVDGLLHAGNANVDGNVQAASLSAGTVTVTSKLDISRASVSILGATYALSQLGTYRAGMDCLVMVTAPFLQVYPPPNNSYYVTGTSGTTTMIAVSGYWQPIGVAIQVGGSFVLPVPAGQQFTIAVGGGYAYGAPVQLAFVPLGAAPKAGEPPFELVAEAGPPDPKIEKAMTEGAARQERAAGEFVGLLEEAIGKPIDDELKEKLVTTLRGG
jgi:cytoskeletal protein CcmA (bactofilin family)